MRKEEDEAQDGRAVLVVVEPLGVPVAELVRAVHEDGGGVRDGHERGEREEPCGDKAGHVVRGNEIEERRRDGADQDCEMQPFL